MKRIYENNNYLPIQIIYQMNKEDTRKREIKGLKDSAKFLGLSKGLILTMDQEETLAGDVQIKVIPAYKYFTMEETQLDFLFD